MPQGKLQLNTYFGPYFLERLIAIGGMAEIYRARTRGLAGFEKQLALKVIHADYLNDQTFVRMLINEAKIAVGLNHRNIAQTFDLGRIENSYFITMEYVDGADLFHILRRLSEMGASMFIDGALQIANEVLCGLDYAHTKCDESGTPLQIIHRDMSPQNILISRSGEVKIVDFGIAKAANLTGKTRAGTIKGKLVYMSPEQAWGDPVDHRADIFSVGVVLHEALSGVPLYDEKNPVRLLELVRKADVPPPSSRRPDLSPELDALVMKALAPRPNDRYQSAREFSSAVAEQLHRISPAYTEEQLGSLVELALETATPNPAGGAKSMAAMDREDFALHQHSVIYSPEEIVHRSRVDLPQSAAAQARPEAAAPSASPPASTERRKARLILLGETGPRSHELGAQFVIGRSGDLRLGDARVSRRHAQIIFVEGSYHLEDLGSANGTFLEEAKLTSQAVLHHGARIRVGPFQMVFDLDGGPAAPEPQPPLRGDAAPGGGARPAPAAWQQAADPSASPAKAGPPEPRQGAPSEPSPSRSSQPAGPLPSERSPAASVSSSVRSGGAPSLRPSLAPELGATFRAPHPPSLAPLADSRSRPAKLEGGANLTLSIGSETLVLPVGETFHLAHSLSLGETHFLGESGALVRRDDGYWFEPSATGRPILLNGEPALSATRLRPGDLVEVGPVQVRFVLGSGR